MIIYKVVTQRRLYVFESLSHSFIQNDMDKKENQVNEIKDLPLNKQTKKN